jgi:hypothetical protein
LLHSAAAAARTSLLLAHGGCGIARGGGLLLAPLRLQARAVSLRARHRLL